MGFLIGKGRHARETYPSPNNNSSAVVASRNRNISTPVSMAGFTPATSPSASTVAALLYTPKVSGVLDISAILSLVNGAAPETYAIAVTILSGTGLSVSGGSSVSDGWVVGSTVPPVIGGVVSATQLVGEFTSAVAASGQTSLIVSGLSQQIPAGGGPLPIGVPVVIEVELTELGGGNAITSLAFTQLSVAETP